MTSFNKGEPQRQALSFGPFCLYARERRLECEGRIVKLGSRALEILTILTERAGDVISKEELTTRVWPDMAIEDSGLRVHIAALRKALGDGRQGARYVANVSGRGYSFVAPVTGTASAPMSPPDTPIRGRDLPPRLEWIVGRDATIREVSEQLTAQRFVTVVGPGGMGKTTVAVAVAHSALDAFRDDVCFVDLGSVTGPAQVETSIASSLGMGPVAGDIVESLIAFLRGRRMLLVLDGCEHVVNVLAPLAERLFGSSATLHLLTTSREPLRVHGEHVHRMDPLEVPPDQKAGVTAAAALRFSAVELFVERARASGARFSLTDDDASVVAEICRRLDGIALAIEFAAGRVEAYGIRGTADLLENRFKLLWHGRRTAPSRHQTLGSLLDWSYNLLDEQERRILRRLSIFVGSFSLDAVAAIDGNDERAVESLGSLIDKSLISVETGGPDGAQYRLLDTTRGYAQAKLADTGERHAVARLHTIHMCSVLERERRMDKDAQVRSLAAYLANTRSALDWAFSEGGDRDLGARLAAAAVPMFMELSLLRECQHWVEVALAGLLDADRGTGRELNLQAAWGVAAMFTRGNGPEVRAALERALALADELGDPREQMRLLGALNILLTRTGEWRDALAIGRRSETVAARLSGDAAAHFLADWMVGTTRHLLGDPVEAEKLCRSAITPSPESRMTAMLYFGFDHRIRALIVLARSLWLLGRAEDARRVAMQAMRDAEETGQPTSVAISLVWSSSVFLLSGDVETATNVVDRLVECAEKHSLGPYQLVGLGLRGEIAVRRDDFSGVEMLRRAIDVLHVGRHDLLRSVFATALAEGLAGLGRFTEALTTINDAIAWTARNDGASFDLPEMFRVKGRLLATMEPKNEIEGEKWLLQAIDMAKTQRAVAWELRAATTLARLQSGQGRHDDARAVLKAAHQQFTQGFATADLRAASRLLSELSGDP